MPSHSDKLPPLHPGEILREDFLVPMGLSAYAVAKAVHVTPQHISAIVRGDRAISPEVAVRLGRYFFGDADRGGRFWMTLQGDYERERALIGLSDDLARIQPRATASS